MIAFIVRGSVAAGRVLVGVPSISAAPARTRPAAYLRGRRQTTRSHAPGRSRRARGAVPHETPARAGIFPAPTSWSSLSAGSPGGAHQHETQAQAVTNGSWSLATTASVCGPVLIA